MLGSTSQFCIKCAKNYEILQNLWNILWKNADPKMRSNTELIVYNTAQQQQA